jgi:hypothetical protein
MQSARAPDAGDHAGEVAFPTDLALLGQGAKEDAAVEEENEQGDEGRAPALHPKGGGDQVGDDAVDEGAGPDMDDGVTARFIAADEPGAQAADDPDG